MTELSVCVNKLLYLNATTWFWMKRRNSYTNSGSRVISVTFDEVSNITKLIA